MQSIQPTHKNPQNKTVVTHFTFKGGLGNQMFEFAFGLAVARKLDLPFRWVWRDCGGFREFGLTHFGIERGDNSPTRMVYTRPNLGLPETFEDVCRIVREATPGDCGILGYFQCEECLLPAAEEVRQIFKLEPADLNVPEGFTPVGVQVRRGDYLGHRTMQVCTTQYYKSAIAFMRKTVENPHFYMISDDPKWCEKTFAGTENLTIMPPQEAIDGLRTMVACSAHIISNSTYGFMGAWLNETGPVVVPERWFNSPNPYGRWNPIPNRWHKVSVYEPVTSEAVKRQPAPIIQTRLRQTLDPTFDKLRATFRELAGRTIYYMPNSGNWGDRLIHEGNLQFFKEEGVDWIGVPFLQCELPKNSVFVYGGGGGWCKHWNHGSCILEKILGAGQVEKIIVMPSTYALTPPQHESVTYFARDLRQSLHHNPGAVPCPDMAVLLSPPVTPPPHIPLGNFFRTDAESANPVPLPENNFDISALHSHLTPSNDLFQLIADYRRIRTDRLHLALAGLILGREVELHCNSYPKIQDFHASWLEDFPGLTMIQQERNQIIGEKTDGEPKQTHAPDHGRAIQSCR